MYEGRMKVKDEGEVKVKIKIKRHIHDAMRAPKVSYMEHGP